MQIGESKARVRRNLDDGGISFYTEFDLNNSLQDAVDEIETYGGSQLRAITFPKQVKLYYDFATYVPDLLSVVGVFDPTNNLWLTPKSSRGLDLIREDWENWRGTPRYFNPISHRYTALVPWPATASGAYLLLYKAIPITINDGYVPAIPEHLSVIIENYCTGDMQEQAKEFVKANSWLNKYYEQLPLVRRAIAELAGPSKLSVLQPYFRFGPYGQRGDSEMWIDNETPSGLINGQNAVFTLLYSPSPSISLILTKNGQLMYQGTAYTLSGNTITFAAAYIPITGDLLRAWYRV